MTLCKPICIDLSPNEIIGHLRLLIPRCQFDLFSTFNGACRCLTSTQLSSWIDTDILAIILLMSLAAN
jgi:hypothetical protein